MGKIRKILIVALVTIIAFVIFAIWSQREKIERMITAEKEIGNPVEHPDYVGTLIISSVGIEVPLVLAEGPDMMQMVVDKMNCAAFIKKVGYVVNGQEKDVSFLIGDHSFQKFKKLPEVEVGAESEIVTSDGTVRKYIVTKRFIGYNIDGNLVYEDGTPIRNEVNDGLILYTCVDETAIPVHIVFLQPA